ncbi:MAG TPA: hypothetical protein VF629_10950 [Hymenobacter sp.]|jgi:hypothetical protein|uniref:hypothetical protein n=1 Tax=Hymenobacter sp. TaxID=1898978 RepID=UPI002ED84D4A
MSFVYSIRIKVNGLRPDFRVVTSFIWDDFYNTDSEGNSYNPASREWTWLYQCDRQRANYSFEIESVDESPGVFEVNATTEALGSRVAYFLARETNGSILDDEGFEAPIDSIAGKLGSNFNLLEALNRADNSIWRKSTLDNPYPNL